MSSVRLHQGDSRVLLRQLIDRGERVHAVVTDPPYGLTSVLKRFGKKDAAPARLDGNDGSFSRLSAGFMGQQWDGTQIERDPDFWALVLEILLPGGYCFAFSGSRTGHWQAAAMETAGFIIHPMHGWIYGQGFPKTKDAAREVAKEGGDPEQWEGWKYGTQSQKPALEPIFLGQKPMSEKNGGKNLVRHGVGAVNIDGCRVPLGQGEVIHTPQSDPTKRGAGAGEYCLGGRDLENMHKAQRESIERTNTLGRYPANLIHDGSPEVAALFPDDAQRYFNHFELTDEDIERAMYFEQATSPLDAPIAFWNSKARKDDRAGSKHPTVKPIALMQHLIRHVTPPGGVVLDPFAGSGTTGEAARREGFDSILLESHHDYFTFLCERFPDGNEPILHTECENAPCESGSDLLPIVRGPTQARIPEVEDLLGDAAGDEKREGEGAFAQDKILADLIG